MSLYLNTVTHWCLPRDFNAQALRKVATGHQNDWRSLTHSGDSVILLCREDGCEDRWGVTQIWDGVSWFHPSAAVALDNFFHLNLCVLLHEVGGGAEGTLCRHNDVMNMASGRVSNS